MCTPLYYSLELNDGSAEIGDKFLFVKPALMNHSIKDLSFLIYQPTINRVEI